MAASSTCSACRGATTLAMAMAGRATCGVREITTLGEVIARNPSDVSFTLRGTKRYRLRRFRAAQCRVFSCPVTDRPYCPLPQFGQELKAKSAFLDAYLIHREAAAQWRHASGHRKPVAMVRCSSKTPKRPRTLLPWVSS